MSLPKLLDRFRSKGERMESFVRIRQWLVWGAAAIAGALALAAVASILDIALEPDAS